MVEYTYNWMSFTVVTVATLLPFLWVFKRPIFEKLYYFSFVFFLWVYAGIGYGWSECPTNYIWPYIIYMSVLSVSCKLANRKRKNQVSIGEMNIAWHGLLNKYGKQVIIIYIILCFLPLVVEGKVINLIHPPEVDLLSRMGDVTEGASMSGITTLIYYVKNIVYVFYIISLYVYKDKVFKFAIALLMPVYLTYAEYAYISRGVIMMSMVTIIIMVYMKYPQYQKKIIIGVLSAIPVAMLVLFWYSLYRVGNYVDIGSINISDAMAALSYQETSYPIHYEELNRWPYDSKLTESYVSWLLNLPFPGFLKIGGGDYAFNVIFSERISGGIRGMEGFYVRLPGIVNESIFLFGHYFYFIHAFILGYIISKVYGFIKYDFELFLLIHIGFSVAYQLGRAGTSAAGVYPFFFKHLLIYLLVRLIVTNILKKIGKCKC